MYKNQVSFDNLRQNLQSDGQATIVIRVRPNAKVTGLAAILVDGSYKISLQASPVDGAANEALIAFLGRELQLESSNIHIISGHTSRFKLLRLRSGS